MNPLEDLRKIFEIAREKKGSGFREAAGELLKNFDCPADKADELLASVIHHPFPRQNFGRADFGQPSVTLFSDGEIALDLYVWKISNLSIHSHNFQGAFKLLKGESFQQTFSFTDRKELFPGIATGKLSFLEKSTVVPGDVFLIDHQDRFIHSIYHTESPSLTLCLRTIGQLPPLCVYMFPHLEIEHRKERELELFKKLDVLKVLTETQVNSVLDLISEGDLGLLYLTSMDDEPEHFVTKAITAKLETLPSGKIFREAYLAHRAFNLKYKRLLKGAL